MFIKNFFIKNMFLYKYNFKKKIRFLRIYKFFFNNHYDFIPNFLNNLEKLEIKNYLKNTFFLKFYVKNPELFLLSNKQYFLSILFKDVDNYKIFLSKFSDHKFGFVLFDELSTIFKNNNIRVSRFKSFSLGIYFLIVQYLKGIKFIFLALINFSNNKFYSDRHSLFMNLTKKNFPLDNNQKNHTIIDWYNENGNIKKIKIISSEKIKKKNISFKNLEIVISSFLFPKINLIKKLKFFVISSLMILESFLFFIFGSKLYAFFIPEILKLLYANMIEKKLLPSQIFFSQSEFAYKPLWTLYFEENNVKIFNYFYACSLHSFMQLNGVYKFPFPCKNSSWPNIMFWSSYIKEDYKKNTNVENIVMSTPIGYSDKETTDLIYNNSLAIFDVLPIRYYEKFKCMYNNKYLNYENVKKFIYDIHKICLKLNFKIIYKPHKNLDLKRNDKRYINFLRKLNNIKILDTDVSARKIIERTNLSISFPWTSTPVIAQHLDKKTFFYDPTGKMSSNDKGSLGIDLIKDTTTLEKYIKQYI